MGQRSKPGVVNATQVTLTAEEAKRLLDERAAQVGRSCKIAATGYAEVVNTLVEAGGTPQPILDILTKRYGASITLNPVIAHVKRRCVCFVRAEK